MEKVVNFRSQSFFKLEVNGLPDTQKSKVEKVSQLFKMLSDPTRLKILLYLKDGEQNVTAITQAVEMEQSAVSHQLRLLEKIMSSSLIAREKRFCIVLMILMYWIF